MTTPAEASLDVVVVNGSPRTTGSKTVALADLVTTTLGQLMPITVERVDAYGLGAGFTGAAAREDVPADVERQLRRVEGADLLIAAAPVYRASYPGMFKHLFDMIDPYGLANKPVLLLATGGSERHALVIEHQLRPLFAFFQALTVPVAFYATAGDFDGTTVLNPEVYSRIEIGLADVLDLLKNRARPGGS